MTTSRMRTSRMRRSGCAGCDSGWHDRVSALVRQTGCLQASGRRSISWTMLCAHVEALAPSPLSPFWRACHHSNDNLSIAQIKWTVEPESAVQQFWRGSEPASQYLIVEGVVISAAGGVVCFSAVAISQLKTLIKVSNNSICASNRVMSFDRRRSAPRTGAASVG